jgi:hypothetical protein
VVHSVVHQGGGYVLGGRVVLNLESTWAGAELVALAFLRSFLGREQGTGRRFSSRVCHVGHILGGRG